MWHTHEGMGWWMVFAGILWILFWVSLIFLLVLAFARGGRAEGPADALEIARRRLARGEISAEQYQEIRRHLVGGPP